MATPSSILTWEIPRTEAPGRLQSTVLKRVGHDSACTHRAQEVVFQGTVLTNCELRPVCLGITNIHNKNLDRLENTVVPCLQLRQVLTQETLLQFLCLDTRSRWKLVRSENHWSRK